MASPKRRRQKKEAARGLRPKSVTLPRTPIWVPEGDNLLEIGGTIGAFSKQKEREGRLFRSMKLRCAYDSESRPSEPWVNVYDSLMEHLLKRSIGDRVCLGGYIRNCPEMDSTTRRHWELYANRIVCERSTNPSGGFARNRVQVRGTIAERKITRASNGNPKCEFTMRCKGPGGRIDLVEMAAYDLVFRIMEWPIKRELWIDATVLTYPGKFAVIEISADGYSEVKK